MISSISPEKFLIFKQKLRNIVFKHLKLKLLQNKQHLTVFVISLMSLCKKETLAKKNSTQTLILVDSIINLPITIVWEELPVRRK